jgi:hypothetical protein
MSSNREHCVLPLGGWLEGPVANPSTTPHRYQLERHGGYFYPVLSTPQQYPLYPAQKTDSSQWGGFAKDKRFMVSRKRQASIGHFTKLMHDSAYM